MKDTHRLIILAGPSCTGKTPLYNALKKFHPEIGRSIQKLVLFTSRQPRPEELEGVDYYFRTQGFINRLRKTGQFLIRDVRGDIQALDLVDMQNRLRSTDILYEGNTFIALELLRHPLFANTRKISVFLSPLNKDEITMLSKSGQMKSFSDIINTLMTSKLKRRLQNMGKALTPKREENIRVRASEAYSELKEAWRFDFILANHDGEDSENWTVLPRPIGDAAKTLKNFYGIIHGDRTIDHERWGKSLIP